MRKFSLLLALLCASVMAFADWTGQVTGSATNVWLDGINTAETRTTVNYTVNYEVGYSAGTLTVTIGFTDDNFDKTVGLVPQIFVDNAYKGNFSANTWSSSDYSTGDELDMYIFFAYNGGSNGSSHFSYTIPSGGGGDPDPGSGAFDPASIDWTTESSTMTIVPGKTQYQVGAETAAQMPNVVNVQFPGWSAEEGIYMTFSSADQLSCSLPASKEGSGMVIYLSNFAYDEITEVVVTWNGGSKTFYVHNNNPIVAPATKAPAPSVALSRVKPIFSQYSLNTDMSMLGWSSGMTKLNITREGRKFVCYQFGNYLGLGYGTNNVSNMDKIHLDIWAENTFSINFYLISPGKENAYTINLTGGQWNSVNIPLSTFIADKTGITEFKFADASIANQTIFLDNIYFYADADLPDPEPSSIMDTNFALRTNGGMAYASSIRGENYAARAIDNDNGTSWESQWDSDPQIFTIDLGQRRIFNTIQMRLYERYARDFYIETSNNGVDWTAQKTITNYSNESPAGYELSIELDNNVTARYVRFRGTARANEYGYSFYEFRVLQAGIPVLTSVTLASNKKIVKIGEYATLTAEPKDQNNSAIPATISYTVTPSAAGHVTDGKFYPDQYGLATVTVTAEAGGEEVSANVQIWGVSSDNLALNNAMKDEFNEYVGTYFHYSENLEAFAPSQAVNGNDGGNQWNGCPTETSADTEDGRTYDAWFVVDLQGHYTLQLIRILFEGACSQNYKLFVSADNSIWSEAYSYSGSYGINAHTDMISSTNLTNSLDVRYVKFLSSKAATPYGLKICEMEVFGEEYVEAGVSVTGITLSQASATIEKDESLTLTATVDPYNATDKSLTWESSDPTVATVAGGVITALKAGTTTITATANDGSGVYGECALTVVPISAKTYWGTYTVTSWDNMPLLWSVTRNSDRTLTYTVYYGGDASGYATRQLNDGVGGTDGWHNLSGYTDADRVASYTTETKYVKGTQLSPNPFFYFGGPRIDLPTSYRIGDSNERPSTAVESVIISAASAKIVKNETLQLTAYVLPSFVENKTILWSSGNTSVADVSSTGLVTAKEVGTAVITATSAADGTKTATCAITVSATLPSATWYGRETFTPGENLVGINYSVTRNTNHTLTYKVSFSENVTGMEAELNDGPNPEDYHNMGYNQSTCSAEWTSSQTYADGEIPTSFFWLKYAGGVKRIDVKDFYTVGADNEDSKPNVYITLKDEDTNNASRISFHDTKAADVCFGRAFVVDDAWYTLCLPFDMSAAQVNEVFGSSKLATLVDAEDRGSLIHLNFDYKNAIEAGMPYLFKPGTDFVSRTTISDVTIKYETPIETGGSDNLMKFVGTYNQTTLTAENQRFVGPDNYLYSPASGGTTMGAFRCYFTIPNGSPGLAPGKRARIVFGEQTATGLSDIEAQHPKAAKFMLDGMLYIIRDGKTYNAQGMLVK